MTDAYPAPLDDGALAATWSAAWSSLSVQASGGLQSELMVAWAEPHRHYHDQRHLRQCLALWAHWLGPCERPGEVAIALWFVDALYDLRDGSNELNCAAWAARSLTRAGAVRDTAQRVHDLVMATRSTKLRRRWGRVPTHGRSSTSPCPSLAVPPSASSATTRTCARSTPGCRGFGTRTRGRKCFKTSSIGRRCTQFALACTPVM